MIIEQTGELAPKNEPERLIRETVGDLILQEKMPGIIIEMTKLFHACLINVKGEEFCVQCFAGCAMSRRLKANPESNYYAFDFPQYEAQLSALDLFRCGIIAQALEELEISDQYQRSEIWILEQTFKVTPYAKSPDAFKRDMLALADKLEEARIS